jgi:hypothetical protein
VMELPWNQEAADEIDELLSSTYGDYDFEFEKIKALEAIFTAADSGWKLDRLREAGISFISDVFVELDATSDDDQIRRKVTKIDEMMDLFDLYDVSEEWDEQREHHLSRRNEELPLTQERINRVDSVTDDDDAEKIADLFKTLL